MVIPLASTDIALTKPAAEVRSETPFSDRYIWDRPGQSGGFTGHFVVPQEELEEKSVAASLQPQAMKPRQSRTEPQNALKAVEAAAERKNALTTNFSLYQTTTMPGQIDVMAQQVLRAHYLPQILSDLRKIQAYCGQPSAAMYADRLLRDMRALRDATPTDPFVEVVLALHDALTLHNKWADHKAHEFEAAREILRKLARKEKLTDQHVERAVNELESAGFDTTPFAMAAETLPDDENITR